MPLIFKVISGPLEGQTFPVEAGLTIGRSRATMGMRESKVSSLHAKVRRSTKGELFLVDNGSTNGTFVNGQKIKHTKLAAGQKISIGRSEILVLEAEGPPASPKEVSGPVGLVKSSKLVDLPDQIAPEAAAPTAPVEPQAQPLKEKTWSERVLETISEVKSRVRNKARMLEPLTPPITLTFHRGLQAETQWLLGYGPRRAGARSVDLPLFEPGAPGLSFEILPSPEGTRFKTVHPQKVLLNGQAKASELLKSGDIITIANTEIEVGIPDEFD